MRSAKCNAQRKMCHTHTHTHWTHAPHAMFHLRCTACHLSENCNLSHPRRALSSRKCGTGISSAQNLRAVWSLLTFTGQTGICQFSGNCYLWTGLPSINMTQMARARLHSTPLGPPTPSYAAMSVVIGFGGWRSKLL